MVWDFLRIRTKVINLLREGYTVAEINEKLGVDIQEIHATIEKENDKEVEK